MHLQDVYGDTALHDAARFGHVEVSRALVTGGTDLSARNKDRKTPQEVAAVHGHEEVVRICGATGRSKL